MADQNTKKTSNPNSSGKGSINDKYPKIQAYVSKLGVMSRRKVEDLIREKKVQVNGAIAKIGQRIKAGEDVIVLDGKKVQTQKPPQPIYYLIYKPAGYVSSVSDERKRRTVLELIPQNITERLYPVGRLDMDSEGLMILTNDGDFTFKMTHPSHEVQKTYHVLIAGSPSNKAINHLQRGVKLKEGYFAPDEFKILRHENGDTWLEIVIHEGKNRLVRRMIKRIGYRVMKLVRVQIGPFTVDMLNGRRPLLLKKEEVMRLVK